jgi:hypothetical protein
MLGLVGCPAARWLRLGCARTRARYEAVNAMLLNEFIKEHRKVEE